MLLLNVELTYKPMQVHGMNGSVMVIGQSKPDTQAYFTRKDTGVKYCCVCLDATADPARGWKALDMSCPMCGMQVHSYCTDIHKDGKKRKHACTACLEWD